MTIEDEKDRRPGDGGETAAPAGNETPADGPRPDDAAGGSEEASLIEEHPLETVARLENEVAELKDQLLRALAEAENTRRRAQKEVADARQYAMTAFARDMLSVADNFRRAMEAMPDGEKLEASGLKGLVEGIEMTERELRSVFERHGIRPLNPEGERFDPNLHQAMFEVPNPDVPAGTVVQVVQEGAVIGERVLRPAMVGVAKGGPKQPPRENADAGAASAGGEDRG